MKTIVEGNKELLEDYKYFECSNCGWVGKANKYEYTIIPADYYQTYKVVDCPVCNNRCYEIQNKNRLEEIRNIENFRLFTMEWNESQGKIGELK